MRRQRHLLTLGNLASMLRAYPVKCRSVEYGCVFFALLHCPFVSAVTKTPSVVLNLCVSFNLMRAVSPKILLWKSAIMRQFLAPESPCSPSYSPGPIVLPCRVEGAAQEQALQNDARNVKVGACKWNAQESNRSPEQPRAAQSSPEQARAAQQQCDLTRSRRWQHH